MGLFTHTSCVYGLLRKLRGTSLPHQKLEGSGLYFYLIGGGVINQSKGSARETRRKYQRNWEEERRSYSRRDVSIFKRRFKVVFYFYLIGGYFIVFKLEYYIFQS